MNKKFTKVVSATLITSMLFTNVMPVYALTKDETIYSKLNANGTVKSTLVNEHLTRSDNEEMEDVTILKDILNINGDESYQEKDGKIVWKTNEKDLFYQGTTDKALPISASITYKLDGEEISLNKLLGQKGHVEIILNYQNNLGNETYVGNKKETLYTPFVVTMGLILNNKENKNISISNGKIVNLGNKNILVGIATPGMYDNLKIKEFKNLDSITISYDTTNFSLPSIYNVATNKIVEDDDLEIFNKLDNLYSSYQLLSSKVDELEEGANTIYEGMESLNDGILSLDSGLTSLYDGITLIQSKLEDSLAKYADMSISDEMISSVKEEATKEAVLALESKKEDLLKQAKNKVDAKFTSYYKDIIGNQAVSNIEKMYGPLDDTTKALIYNTAVNTSYTVALETAKETTYETAIQIAKILAPTIAENILKETTTTIMKETTSSLKELTEAINYLETGVTKLQDGSSKLVLGSSNILEGNKSLSEGIHTFNEQGIKKLNSYFDYELINKVKKLSILSKEYQTLDSKADSANGKSKLIMVIDSVEKKSAPQKENTKKVKTSFWDRIVNLFK